MFSSAVWWFLWFTFQVEKGKPMYYNDKRQVCSWFFCVFLQTFTKSMCCSCATWSKWGLLEWGRWKNVCIRRSHGEVFTAPVSALLNWVDHTYCMPKQDWKQRQCLLGCDCNSRTGESGLSLDPWKQKRQIRIRTIVWHEQWDRDSWEKGKGVCKRSSKMDPKRFALPLVTSSH